jgi:hypothetical protein
MCRFAMLCLVVSLICSITILADDDQARSDPHQLPPIETFLLEPVELENISIWVPAGRTGPFINRSCRPKKNCSYSCVLPATVHHTKTELCPEEVARLLAEHTAYYHKQSLPLTIFNGWRWEYFYSLCQFESVTYDLPQRGGCWENSWEAVLTQSTGSANFQWLQVFPSDRFVDRSDSNKQKSLIEVKTFNSMRTRDGYPKKRQL